jgi:hypothetical protein
MSGFYDDASWVLIPEGIKEDVVYAQKPTDGLGDLTFTRASDATRTNSAGVIERTPWNLLQMSEMFSDASWTKTSATIGINTTTAPNGTLTADTLTGSGASGIRSVYRFIDFIAGRNYNISIYAKKNTNNFLQIVIGGGFGNDFWANFDLNAGVVGSFGIATTASIQSVGDGWYRCSISGLCTSTATGSCNYLLVTSATSARAETNTLTTSAYIWGAQLVEGTDAKPYFATTNRQDVPRLDYRNADGSLNSCPRLLLEPQRTNSIRNSTNVGAVAGSPGTLPTNWERTSGGLTQTIVGIGTENGLQYIDFNFAGTASGTLTLFYETLSQIVASNGQTWSNSFYAKLISGSADSFVLVIRELSSIGGNLGTGTQTFSPTSNLQRFTFTRTNANALTAFIRPGLFVNLTIGATYDFTIRIAAPQMELGAYATTFIPTTTAAVTRLADDAIKEGISSLIGQTEGTIFADIRYEVAQTSGIAISDGTSAGTNWIFFRFPNTTTDSRVYISASGVVLSQVINSVFTANQSYKIALGYKSGNWALYVNGNSIASGTDTFTFSANFDRVILSAAGAARLGSPVYAKYNQAALFPTRLTNAQLAELTTL